MRSTSTPAKGALGLLGAFVAVSTVIGLLLAGLAMPAAYATGTVTSGSVDFFNSLPAELAEPPLAEQSTVLDADGRPIAHFYDERRILKPLSKISPNMRKAIIAIEDSRFYQHGGVDPRGLTRAFLTNQVNDGVVQGASTLTQQYIKLRILDAAVSSHDKAGQQAALAKNYSRKVQEVRMAVALEKKRSKDEILAGYLNIALFGRGVYGAEAASQYFFDGTPAKHLTVPQAALLAGLVQWPTRYDPIEHPDAALKRRNVVLARMLELSAITQAEYDQAVASPLGVKPRALDSGCVQARSSAYFCSYVREVIKQDPGFSALGKTPKERGNNLKRGGLIIRTTLNQKIQLAAKDAIEKKVPTGDPSGVGTVAVTVEPGTGNVLAMAENRSFFPGKKLGQTEINFAANFSLGSNRGFQPGSTFKPFTLATWLAQGKGLYDVVDSGQRARAMNEFETCKGKLPKGLPAWEPHNSEGHGGGSMTVMDATRSSVNTAYVDMASKLSLCDIAKTATSLGVQKAWAYNAGQCQGEDTTKLPDCTPSMVLGAVEVAPLSMAAAYAAFAAEGKYCKPLVVTSITDRDGKNIPVPGSSCTQALEPNVTRGVIYALKPVLVSGTAAGNGIDRPAAGKTGTTDDSKDTWFIGFTPQRATAVWVGDNPDPIDGKARKSINNRKIGSQRYGNIYGATIAAPLWRTIMKVAHEGLPQKDWANPSGKALDGSSVRMPGVVGKSVAEGKAELEAAGFEVSVGEPVPSDMGPDRIAQTSPEPGARVAPDSKVTILPGNGQGGGQGQDAGKKQDNGNGDGNGDGDGDGAPQDNRITLKKPLTRHPRVTVNGPVFKKPPGG